MVKQDLEEKIEVPEGIEVKLEKSLLTIKGAKGEVSRRFLSKKIDFSVDSKQIILSSKKATKRENNMIKTFKAHIKNMLKGAQEGHSYTLKVCSSHFPMTTELKNKVFSVKNFLGEKVPRTYTIVEGVDIKVEGDIITINSTSKELAGQTAGSIEQMCKITNRDRRIFQDGIYITDKDGKSQ